MNPVNFKYLWQRFRSTSSFGLFTQVFYLTLIILTLLLTLTVGTGRLGQIILAKHELNQKLEIIENNLTLLNSLSFDPQLASKKMLNLIPVENAPLLAAVNLRNWLNNIGAVVVDLSTSGTNEALGAITLKAMISPEILPDIIGGLEKLSPLPVLASVSFKAEQNEANLEMVLNVANAALPKGQAEVDKPFATLKPNQQQLLNDLLLQATVTPSFYLPSKQLNTTRLDPFNVQ